MTVRLRYRIIGLAVLAATLSVAITLGIISHHRTRVAERIVAEINVLARDALRQQVQGVLDLVSTSNTLIGQSVMHGLDITVTWCSDAEASGSATSPSPGRSSRRPAAILPT